MIVDDYHTIAAILSREAAPVAARPPVYLDARVPATMHLRLVSALHKPGAGRLTQLLQSAAPDPAYRSALIEAIASPRLGSLTVLDDRPLAAAIGALTSEAGVSIAFAALIAHAQAAGQPVLIDPANAGRWLDTARRRRIEVVTESATVR